jgi:hypothetical protein
MMSHYVVQAALELVIFLPQLPECWNYRHMPLCVECIILILQSRDLFSFSISSFFPPLSLVSSQFFFHAYVELD